MNQDAWLLEKKSSAVTMSRHELFLFPDLMYAAGPGQYSFPAHLEVAGGRLVRENVKKRSIAAFPRLKPIHHGPLRVHLDLDTWGLTTKERELARFRGFLGRGCAASVQCPVRL